ncbi:protein kinase domain-containing protein [Shouchella lehensis]|uniref:Protein kinase family protein n=1 Tax=Shouchella lehensis TaxID=300825 RepID=A0A4Y7WH71_9BACI|nr:protein kinase [Shouchella lehensis]MBG9782373.1 hypothetical protein [Shouchella lehensis]TES46890.1 protein kinase family protein [Shouchella lehensis]
MKTTNSSAKQKRFTPGTVVTGKWNQQQYSIVRKLGEGVTGTVYLAHSSERKVAIKFGIDHMSIAQEVNVLKELSKVQDTCLGPYLYEVDDYVQAGSKSIVPFYVMEYIKGIDFLRFMEGKGSEWLSVVVLQLLDQLQALHDHGWIFGDIKPENIIVTKNATSVRLLDVGGTTKKDRAIKEYTELYDRGYWLGESRKAEVSYDLFSVAILMIHCAYPQQLRKQPEKPLAQLKKMIESSDQLKPFKKSMIGALHGHYIQAGEMKQDLLRSQYQAESSPTLNRHSTTRMSRVNKQKKSYGYTELFMLMTFVGLLITLYLVLKMF